MTAGGPTLQLVPDDLPEYPVGVEDRLTTHFFVTFHHDRWLNSEFRLKAEPAVRGLALDLYFLSQKQSPVGTLPNDDRQLAPLLLMSTDEWLVYRQKDPSPLYKWTQCRCGNEIRLMHPVVLEVVEDAISHKRQRREAAEQGRTVKRLNRLREALERMGAGHIAANDACVERLDNWLLTHCPGNRTATQIERALMVDAQICDGNAVL